MRTCTFFGHRDCPDHIRQRLKAVLTDLIVNQGVDIFYVGDQGQFDALVRRVLRELVQEYPQVGYAVVLAYMPGAAKEYEDSADTMVPERIETVHPRYAIAWRNRWVLRKAEFVVTYITRPWGGAAQFAAQAQKMEKTVIHISGCAGD